MWNFDKHLSFKNEKKKKSLALGWQPTEKEIQPGDGLQQLIKRIHLIDLGEKHNYIVSKMKYCINEHTKHPYSMRCGLVDRMFFAELLYVSCYMKKYLIGIYNCFGLNQNINRIIYCYENNQSLHL